MRQKNTEEMRRFNLVIPTNLYEKVQSAAKRDRRTVTAQILLSLEWMTREMEEESPQSVISVFGLMRAMNDQGGENEPAQPSESA